MRFSNRFKKITVMSLIIFIFNLFQQVNIMALDNSVPIDLIKNGGFETFKFNGQLEEWYNYTTSGGFNVQVDTTYKKEGVNSVKLSSGNINEAAKGGFHQTIKTIPMDIRGNSIKISQWVKTKDFEGDGLVLRLQFKDKDGNFLHLIHKDYTMPTVKFDTKSTMDWTLLEYVLDFPKYEFETLLMEFLFNNSKGSIWIDNVKAEPYKRLQSISFNDSLTKLAIGKSTTLKPIFTPSDATNKLVTYKSTDESVVKVDNNGNITGIKAGIAKVATTQSFEGIYAEIPIIVENQQVINVTPISPISIKEEQVAKGKVTANSTNAGTLSYNIFTEPKNGIVSLKPDGAFEYYPNKYFVGSDLFFINIKDSKGNNGLLEVKVNVEKADPKTINSSFFVITDENKVAFDTLSINISDNPIKSYQIVKKPQYGNFKISIEGKYKYIPNKNYNGYDYVQVKAYDFRGNYVILEGTIYIAPSTAKIKSSVIGEHPRLLASKEDFARAKNLVFNDSNAAKWFNQVKIRVDNMFTEGTVKYSKPDGVRLNTQGAQNIFELSFVYKITGDVTYAKRAWEEMDNIIRTYPDWNPEHLLDTATMANGMAIGYDWLYDYLTTTQKKQIEDALTSKALNLANDIYTNGSHFFVKYQYNWNFVCNTGFANAALAIIGNGSSDFNAKIIQESFKSLQYSLLPYSIEGDTVEGISYWEYGAKFLTYLLSSISVSMKGENLFANLPAIRATADYSVYLSGKDGTFNHGDNNEEYALGSIGLWFAKEYNMPELTWYHKYYMEQKTRTFSVTDILWYVPELYKGETPEALDKAYNNNALVTMRKDWNDNLSSFLGFKGGTNGLAHGDLDIGSFVYDTLGIRWATDLGYDNYNLPGYWEMEENGRRWKYYRKRAEGHNTLVINKSTNPDQVVNATAPILESKLNGKNGGYGILDLTPAYAKDALKVNRGFSFINRNEVLIRDEFLLKEAGTVAWQMHTEANIGIVEGGKAAILTDVFDNSKHLYIKLLTEGNLTFKIESASPRPEVTSVSGQNTNDGIKKLTVTANGVEGSIDIWMAPYMEGQSIPTNTPKVTPLSGWKSIY